MQTEDIAVWLAEHARLQDTVIVHMDLGQGREFELLHALLTADMLGMIDHIVMRWHYQLAVSFIFASAPSYQ